MTDAPRYGSEQRDTRLERMEWNEIHEPGSYLHLASGLIARVYAEDIAVARAHLDHREGGSVVRLLPDPGAPMVVLQAIAERHGLRVAS